MLSIQDERNSYNDVIHDTGTEQLLLNIVRAHQYETPSFFDVIEVDQTKTLQGNLQGGSSNIGAALTLGALSSTLTAADSPVIKYQPPSSAGFIQQVIQPISLASLSRLLNSNVNNAPLFRLAINRLTPGYDDFFWAADIVDALDAFGAVRLDELDDRTVKLALLPNGLLAKSDADLLSDKPLKCMSARSSTETVRHLWANLISMMGRPPASFIPLKLASNTKQKGSVVVTRSALGALRMAEGEDAKDVVFIPKAKADAIRQENNDATCFSGEYYYIGDADGTVEDKWRRQYKLLTEKNWPSSATSRSLRKLGHSRALIIVEESSARPSNAYVSVFRKGFWYAIDDKDDVSKKNFALLGNLLIIQAQPPASPPTPTVISVGGTK